MDYEPLPEVKQYTLDQKVFDEIGAFDSNKHKKANEMGERIDRLKEKEGLLITLLKIVGGPAKEENKKRMMECLKVLFVKSDKIRDFIQKSSQDQINILTEHKA
jgi:hypothetical protein